MTPVDRDKSTLPDSKRGSLATTAKRTLAYCQQHRLGNRMQVLLYGVVEGQPAPELERRVGVDLEVAKRTFRRLTGNDVGTVAKLLVGRNGGLDSDGPGDPSEDVGFGRSDGPGA